VLWAFVDWLLIEVVGTTLSEGSRREKLLGIAVAVLAACLALATLVGLGVAISKAI
jgi:hypothetical protein